MHFTQTFQFSNYKVENLIGFSCSFQQTGNCHLYKQAFSKAQEIPTVPVPELVIRDREGDWREKQGNDARVDGENTDVCEPAVKLYYSGV